VGGGQVTHVVRVVCRPALVEGFALAGVSSLSASDGEEAAARIARLLRQSEVGVLLVEEGLYAALPDDTRRTLDQEPLPIVVPFPGPTWAEREPAEAYVVELLRRAIGYRVRL
jgi:vacuolar-type H+-ATPase subunit F/Vma7